MFEEAVAGAAAGVVGTALGYPLDTIKTRMQTSHSTILNAIRTTYREESLIGFYRGIASPLLSLTILNTMNFSMYSMNCRLLGLPTSSKKQSDKIEYTPRKFEWSYGVAGAMVGPLASMVSTPFELVKTKMQLGKSKLPNPTSLAETTATSSSERSSAIPKTSIEMARSIFSKHGILGLYQGHVVNTLREMVFISTYFITYENTKNFFTHYLFPSNPSIAIPVSGGISGAIGWFVSFPLDNIKSNIQTREFLRSSSSHSAASITAAQAEELRKSAYEATLAVFHKDKS
jgi:solute carrier family 25 carnitine/acylcarnitine transporter 20/29